MDAKRSAAACGLTDDDVAGRGGSKRMRVGSIEEYDMTCALGKGAFGYVLKARHRATGKDVAIKFLRRRGGRDPAPLSRELMLEAVFLTRCRGHPSVVSIHEMSRHPRTGACGLVMEHVGPSLQRVLKERHGRRRFTEDETRRVMRQLLSGVERMHECRTVHRDIKPGNILVGDGGDVVKICDFGLAMSMTAKPPHRQAGTLCYMAPEMLLGKPDYDERVDLWSLGCVMAELLAGVPLFRNRKGVAFNQLMSIFYVLGVPCDATWPGFASLPLAGKVPRPPTWNRNRLRELFPERRLSWDGFEVLNGLLTCNPATRLSAAAALRLPWFAAAVDGTAAAATAAKTCPPALPKQEAASFPTIPVAGGRVGVAG